jgi:hypothetical protein
MGTLLVKLKGKCVRGSAAIFELDDGSGKIIAGVLCEGAGKNTKTGQNPAKKGEQWEVWGHLEKLSWAAKEAPLTIWTAPSHMKKLQ